MPVIVAFEALVVVRRLTLKLLTPKSDDNDRVNRDRRSEWENAGR